MLTAPETRVFGALLLEQRKVMVRLAGEDVVNAVVEGLPADQREE
jgi:hypothetical protein